jgi:hypothetical protein
MKFIILLLIILTNTVTFSQNIEDKVKPTQKFADSIDNAIINSSGLPGEIFCNTVNLKRNERAIGMQETKIGFYFMQKEDSIIENGNEVHFFQVYNPPIKIMIEYNIASSQNVKVCYYFYDKYIYYTFKSTGAYGYNEEKYIITKSDINYFAKFEAESKNPVEEKFKDFTTDEIIQYGKIYSNSLEYEKLYFQIFNSGQLDK